MCDISDGLLPNVVESVRPTLRREFWLSFETESIHPSKQEEEERGIHEIDPWHDPFLCCVTVIRSIVRGGLLFWVGLNHLKTL